jgi:murein DD-endopeptidase MepM/ murein hydrolase activator NlpD
VHAADDLAVLLRPSLIQPGHVVRLTVTAPADVSSVSATWRDRAVVFAREADGTWQALIGIDVAEEPGPRTIALSARRTDGAALAISHPFQVAPKSVRTRRITVDPKFVEPPAGVVPRIQEEAVLLNSQFDKTLPERLWAFDASRPVEGVAVSNFGVRTILNGRPGGPHNGLDLAAVTGTPIYAPTGGVVVFARDFYYTGNTVVLDHGQGLYSTLAHLSAIDVHEGDRVTKGALVGKVGATGRVTGAHLHWGVRLHGARVDPLSLIESLSTASGLGTRDSGLGK